MRIMILMLLTCLITFGQNKIYKSKHFELFPDSLSEGNYFAKVVSGKEIVSNYLDEYKRSDNYILKFKFAINGLDNENIPGLDHKINLLAAKKDTFRFTFGRVVDNKEKTNKVMFEPKCKFTIQVDLSEVFNELENKGFYKTNTGMVIKKDDFKNLCIAGNISPLSWEFGSERLLKLNRIGDTSIFTVDIKLNLQKDRIIDNGIVKWHLRKDLSEYPEVKSDFPVINAMYNLSIEEMLEDIRPDKTFMAGKKWDGVWTRDISYSIILAMAYLNPQISMNSLLKKVNNDGVIIQDTGTGGSWPISTDRIVWVIAAYEVYKVTGDKEWLKKIYDITKKTLDIDLKTIADSKDGLIYGETSFLDWREQTYPVWMEPKDIFQSKSLSTNVLFYEALKILGEIELRLGIEVNGKYKSAAESLKEKITERFFIKEKNYFGEYIYGDYYQVLSERGETLGNALAILFNVIDNKIASEIVSNLPLLCYGTPSVYPQREGIPPYHNDGIWPFVVGYYGVAANKVKNQDAVNYAISSIYRAALLFLTNKENMVAQTGLSLGTEINSDRQLWSVAANIATVYKMLLGMNFTNEGIAFNPVVPKEYSGKLEIKGLKYRNMTLNIILEGYGSEITEMLLNGKQADKHFIPSYLGGEVNVSIKMNNIDKDSHLNIVENKYLPLEPIGADTTSGKIFVNGKKGKAIEDKLYNEIQSYNVKNGIASLLSKPIIKALNSQIIILKDEKHNYVELSTSMNTNFKLKFNVEEAGLYKLVLEYANGNGPINTDNNVCIRSAYVDKEYKGVFVLPQRGIDKWNSWGDSNSLFIDLTEGEHQLNLTFDKFNKNMDGKINEARISKLKITRIK